MEEFSGAELSVLDPARNKDYGPRPIPSARDEEINRLVSRIKTPRDFIGMVKSLDPRHDTVLLGFAERMASLAVRRNSPADIQTGIVSAGLAAQVTKDLREVWLILPLLLRASQILGRDPAADFEATTRKMSQEAGKVVREFANRNPENRTIEAMGYIESSDADGFRFRRTW